MRGGSRCAAIVVAAGSSTRMGGIDKIFAELGGMPVLRRTALALCASDYIERLVIVTRAERIEEVRALCADLPKPFSVVCGGSSRSESVRFGLRALPGEISLVAVHDGARPLITADRIDEVIAAAEESGAAILAVPLRDTVKQARGGKVLTTPERATLFAAQTPQVFDRALLTHALAQAQERELNLTDDASAVEALGHTVLLSRGSDENIKLTTPVDFRVAEAILRERRENDAHRTRI